MRTERTTDILRSLEARRAKLREWLRRKQEILADLGRRRILGDEHAYDTGAAALAAATRLRRRS